MTPLSDKSLKVTDRRMFTPDGQLRDEYRDLEERLAQSSGSPPPADAPGLTSASGPASASDPSFASTPPAVREPIHEPEPPQEVASPPADEAVGTPGFLDLVGLLAEPATLYLREARNADPQSAAQSLELARLHIDLLNVLRTKTAGNLESSEQAMLEDVIFQLRSGYIGLRG